MAARATSPLKKSHLERHNEATRSRFKCMPLRKRSVGMGPALDTKAPASGVWIGYNRPKLSLSQNCRTAASR